MQRAEIITIERRRRWGLSEKQALVAETLKPGASVSAVAKRYGLHPSRLFAWRKAARDGRLVEENGIEFCAAVHATHYCSAFRWLVTTAPTPASVRLSASDTAND